MNFSKLSESMLLVWAAAAVGLAAAARVAEVQLAGCNTDCGRVEVRYDAGGEWHGLAANDWTLRDAEGICAALGFDAAASASAAFGGGRGAGPVAIVGECEDGSERERLPCARPCVTDAECARAPVGASCRSAGPATADAAVAAAQAAIDLWGPTADARGRRLAAAHASYAPPPNPFDDGALASAYVYGASLAARWASARARLDDGVAGGRALAALASSGRLVLTPFGADLADGTAAERDLVAAAYGAGDAHGAFQAFEDSMDGDASPTTNPVLAALRKNGFAPVDDWGLGERALDALARAADAALADTKARRSVSVTSGGAVATARIRFPELEAFLDKNATVNGAIAGYLGAFDLAGYKATRLATESPADYIAGLWHHDRVGRRLKAFFFLHDVDCDEGHPTEIAVGSHRLAYYFTDSFAASRFTHEAVADHFDLARGCGRRGGGFLFDTRAIHRGTAEGKVDRTLLIAEYHAAGKCAIADAANLGLPCPSGDQWRVG